MSRRLIFAMLLLTIVIGCTYTPKKFDIGDETVPPSGCQELRERGGEC